LQIIYRASGREAISQKTLLLVEYFFQGVIARLDEATQYSLTELMNDATYQGRLYERR
jgi:hypothetical protein